MKSRFMRHLRGVAIVHVLVVAILILFSSGSSFLRKKPELVMPVEFVVEVPAAAVAEEAPVAVEEPEPVPPPRESVPAPRKRPIQRSRKKVARTPEQTARKPTLSDEQIRKLLDEGARPGSYTSILDEDSRCLEMVRRALYAAWSQPSAADAGAAVSEVAIRLDAGGRITGRELKKASGNAMLDGSVMQAVNAVGRVDGLTPSFLARHEVITVSFKVE